MTATKTAKRVPHPECAAPKCHKTFKPGDRVYTIWMAGEGSSLPGLAHEQCVSGEYAAAHDVEIFDESMNWLHPDIAYLRAAANRPRLPGVTPFTGPKPMTAHALAALLLDLPEGTLVAAYEDPDDPDEARRNWIIGTEHDAQRRIVTLAPALDYSETL